jgi:hypothetical protein
MDGGERRSEHFPLGDKYHLWGPSSPLGVNFTLVGQGEVKNGPLYFHFCVNTPLNCMFSECLDTEVVLLRNLTFGRSKQNWIVPNELHLIGPNELLTWGQDEFHPVKCVSRFVRSWVTTPALYAKIYNASSSLTRFEKRSSLLQHWCCSCKFRSRRIGSWKSVTQWPTNTNLNLDYAARAQTPFSAYVWTATADPTEWMGL